MSKAADLRLAERPWLPLLVVAVVGGAVAAVASDRFLTSANGVVVLQDAAAFALLGFAAMVVLAVRDISLAVGGIGSACAVLFGWLVQEAGTPALVAAALTVLLGLTTGVLNGVLISVSRLSGFIVTLATGAAWGGLAIALTRSAAFTDIPDGWTGVGRSSWGPVPLVAVLVTVLAAALALVYTRLPVGRRMLAYGGNPDAARLSGISASRQVVLAHALSGGFAALAALAFVTRIGAAPPDLGADWLLISFAVPIIGGTSLLGGRVSVVGALIGALVLATINDVLILFSVSAYGVTFAQGVLILVALLAGQLPGWLSGRRRRRPASPQQRRGHPGDEPDDQPADQPADQRGGRGASAWTST